LANEVRGVLPTAYAYCLADCEEDALLRETWKESVQDAFVFAEREWVAAATAEATGVYFDDLEDRRFLPPSARSRRVTSGHLGNTRLEQARTAEALRLPFLSSSISTKWSEGEEQPLADGWSTRFEVIWDLLRSVRRGESTENGSGNSEAVSIRHYAEILLRVGEEGGAEERVPVNARLHQGVLKVAGKPVQFGPDAAKELLGMWSFGQRGGLAADLTGMLTAMDHEEDFVLAADKFRRSFAPDFDWPRALDSLPVGEGSTDSVVPEGESNDITAETAAPQAPSADSEPHLDSNDPVSTASLRLGEERSRPPEGTGEESDGGSFTRGRALAPQDATAKKLASLEKELLSRLKGEVVPAADDDSDKAARDRPVTGTFREDRVYRRVAAEYERQADRCVADGDFGQEGWDLQSTDPKTGEIRLIEVKGKSCPWEHDEVVELSRTQVRKAFQSTLSQGAGESWWLYVVERMSNGDYQVLPIRNPTETATKWILSGDAWRRVASDRACISLGSDAEAQ